MKSWTISVNFIIFIIYAEGTWLYWMQAELLRRHQPSFRRSRDRAEKLYLPDKRSKAQMDPSQDYCFFIEFERRNHFYRSLG